MWKKVHNLSLQNSGTVNNKNNFAYRYLNKLSFIKKHKDNQLDKNQLDLKTTMLFTKNCCKDCDVSYVGQTQKFF